MRKNWVCAYFWSLFGLKLCIRSSFLHIKLWFSIYWSVCAFFNTLNLKIAQKSGLCSFLVAFRSEIVHILLFFTVFTPVFPFTGASAHFSPARALNLRRNRVCAHFWWLFDLKLCIYSCFLQFSHSFFQLLERLLIFRLLKSQKCAEIGFCSVLVTDRSEIAHILQFFYSFCPCFFHLQERLFIHLNEQSIISLALPSVTLASHSVDDIFSAGHIHNGSGNHFRIFRA